MADPTSTTPPAIEPAPTGGGEPTPPAATEPPAAPGAATDDDEMVTIKKSDYTALQGQRDRNHERARVIEQHVIEDMQKKDIGTFLGNPDNAKKFPDVTVDDLMIAADPDEFEEVAGQTQARIDEAVQKRLGDIEKATTPVLSPDEKAEELKKLKANPGSASFQRMLELQDQPK